MLIVISNDDGYTAAGIHALVNALRPLADLLVVAPDGPRSGFGCAITSTEPLHLRHVSSEPGLDVYACSGSPVDCVKMAFNVVLPRLGRTPDLVCAGINHGDNSSVNSFYSGTMGAVNEGTLQGIPSVGFSLCEEGPDADFAPCLPYVARIAQRVLSEGLPPFTCLNVNFPSLADFPGLTDYRGVLTCRMSPSRWINEIAESRRPKSGKPYYWLVGEELELEPEATDTDRWALHNGYVAVTPQTLDTTSYALFDSWRLDD